MTKLKNLIPRDMRLPLLALLILQLLVYSGTKPLMAGFHHYDFTMAWDQKIPFVPWTISIYVLSYLFWVVNSILGVRYDKTLAFRYLCADALAKFVSLLFFVLLPTTCTRANLDGNSIWLPLVRLIYAADTPDNLFPSLHCLMSWLCWLNIRRQSCIPKSYRLFSLVFALLIFVSTLTTRQHVLVDVIGGWAIAEGCYHLAGRAAVREAYVKLLKKLHIYK